jgi:diguanylate cyclase (GGDEF)-like protein
MSGFLSTKSRQSAALLIGIMLTVVAVLAHRFFPDRRLSLDTSKEGAVHFLMKFGEENGSSVDWMDESRRRFKCNFLKESTSATCSYTYLLYAGTAAEQGVDLSRYKNLNLSIRYSGSAHYLRVAIRNFNPAYSRVEDTNSSKFNALNIQPKDLAKPVAIGLHEFSVPEWWVAQFDLPRHLAQPEFGNATAFSIYLQGEAAGSVHDIQIDKIEFSGDWISAEYWYLAILCAWMLFGIGYGTLQLLSLRRKDVEQRKTIYQLQDEKDMYRKLSTIDGLTKVLNRHGIERFLETLKEANLPTSVVILDLDHFKRINDHRGHYDGDRVLQAVGDLLREHTRKTDGLGRWGGEEFVLVCPGASLSKAADLAEKLRERIMKHNFLPEDPLAVTASFGVATSPAGGSFDDAFRQADQALYLAKSRGRNCVVAASADQMHKVTGARKGTWALISGRFKLHDTAGAEAKGTSRGE